MTMVAASRPVRYLSVDGQIPWSGAWVADPDVLLWLTAAHTATTFGYGLERHRQDCHRADLIGSGDDQTELAPIPGAAGPHDWSVV
jgi:hypothetical protein